MPCAKSRLESPVGNISRQLIVLASMDENSVSPALFL